MHRGGEKLSESMDFRQGIGYQDRTDYLAQFLGEQAYCMAVEKMHGRRGAGARGVHPRDPLRAEPHHEPLHVPGRIRHRPRFFGTSFTYGFREREFLQDIFEEVSGDRLMYGYFRPGGVVWDVPPNFKQRVREVLPKTRQGLQATSTCC